MLEFEVKNQKITRTDSFEVVADSRNYLTARFVFSEEWQGNIVAVFGFGGEFFQLELDEKGGCTVPFEVIKAPCFSVSVFCEQEQLVTANAVTVDVEKSGFEDGEVPGTPTPTVFGQYINEMRTMIEELSKQNGSWNISEAAIAEAVKNYMKENPVEVPIVTLTETNSSITADKTFEEISAAYSEGKNVIGLYGSSVLTLIIASASVVGFLQIINKGFKIFFCSSSNAWTTSVVNVATTEYVDDEIGDIEVALENIITKYGLGGDTV